MYKKMPEIIRFKPHLIKIVNVALYLLSAFPLKA